MRALLDVNVLIALLDADHSSHGAALNWFAANAAHGWASCPIPQTGGVRIMSHPGTLAVSDIFGLLRRATSNRVHEFWSHAVSPFDRASVMVLKPYPCCWARALYQHQERGSNAPLDRRRHRQVRCE